jgi:hypothetical protein
MRLVQSVGRRRQGRLVGGTPDQTTSGLRAGSEQSTTPIFSFARSFLCTPRIRFIRRSWVSGRKRIVSTTDIRGSKHYILYVPGPTCRGPIPLCMPPSAIKGEACDVTRTHNLRLTSSYKSSSNTSHSGVGYYAPVARTTLNPRVFLCTAPSLHQSSETPKPLLISGLRAGALRHPAEDLLSWFGALDRGLGVRFSLVFPAQYHGPYRRAPR